MNLSYRIVSVAIHKSVEEYSKFLQCIDQGIQEVVLKVSRVFRQDGRTSMNQAIYYLGTSLLNHSAGFYCF